MTDLPPSQTQKPWLEPDPRTGDIWDIPKHFQLENGDEALTADLETIIFGDQPFPGLTHAEVLELDFPPERMLVDNLIPIGTVGTIAGVPETYKSWQAQTIAIGCAKGEGTILDCPVVHQVNVGYFWQDDSTREEAERIKHYETVKAGGTDLPLRWHLNEGLRLPEHTGKLRATIDHYQYGLVILDSFYNVLFGTDLKDEGAEQVVAQLKTEISDPTGCTILIVDHMPWATDSNRQRLRAYGGVFKNAATRFGIYIDAVGSKLYVEARGNNISGIKRQPAEWVPERLELKLLGHQDAIDDEEYEQRITSYLAEHPNARTGELSGTGKKIKGSNDRLLAARGRLLDKNEVVRARERTSSGPYLWNLSNSVESTSTDPQTYQGVLDEKYGGTEVRPFGAGVPYVPVTRTPADPSTKPPPHPTTLEDMYSDEDLPF